MHPARTADLVRAATGGDDESWNALVDRFTPLMWSVARSFRLQRADAADAVALGWLRLLENLPRIADPDAVGAWLATTVRRECLRKLGQAGREQASGMADYDTIDLSAPPVDARLLAAERAADIRRAVDSLPELCRRMMRLLMTDPTPSYAEISAALDIPAGSIGPTRGRCLGRLRNLLTPGSITAAGSCSAQSEERGESL